MNDVDLDTWLEELVGASEASIPKGSNRLARRSKTPGSGVDPSPPTPEGSQIPQDERPLDPSGPLEPSLDLGLPDRGFNLVLSNIISATLIRMVHQVAARLEPGGAWIVSGIIEQNWPEVRAAAEGADFGLAVERHEDGWVAARFHRLEVED